MMSSKEYRSAIALPELLLDADVPERLHGPDDPALFILEKGRGNADRNPASRGIHNMDGPVDDGFSRLNGFAEDAAFFADIRLEHVLAALADRLIAADAGNLLCRPVERGDAPVVVDGKNTVGNRIEDDVLFHALFITYLPAHLKCKPRWEYHTSHHPCSPAMFFVVPVMETARSLHPATFFPTHQVKDDGDRCPSFGIRMRILPPFLSHRSPPSVRPSGTVSFGKTRNRAAARQSGSEPWPPPRRTSWRWPTPGRSGRRA